MAKKVGAFFQCAGPVGILMESFMGILDCMQDDGVTGNLIISRRNHFITSWTVGFHTPVVN